tara:strand:- start:644 stop:859 length:216 start_codon:yes stop_codon:yes gene_type:complete
MTVEEIASSLSQIATLADNLRDALDDNTTKLEYQNTYGVEYSIFRNSMGHIGARFIKDEKIYTINVGVEEI